MADFLALLFFSIFVFSTNLSSSNGVHLENHQGNKFIIININSGVVDFYKSTANNLSLHTVDLSRNSSPSPFSEINLIRDNTLQAIDGSMTWKEPRLVAQTEKVPIISLIPATSLTMPKNELPVINMFDDLSVRSCFMFVVIVTSFKWPKVIGLYEETNLYTNNLGTNTLLSASFCDHGVELENYSAFPAMSSLSEQNMFNHKALDKSIAKILENRNNSKTLLHHIVGKSYREIKLLSFNWSGITNSVPIGLVESGTNKRMRIAVPASSTFAQFVKVDYVNQNITYISGFSIGVFEAAVRYLQYSLIYNSVPFYGSYDDLIEQVYSFTYDAVVGDIQINSNRNHLMRIAVPASSIFTQFVKVIHDVNQNITYIGGFSIRVFEAAVRYLQYPLIYNLVPFYGSHDDMMKEVSLNNFDAAIGDILITANKNQPVEFSHPYIESNLVMVVTKAKPKQQFWLFLKPFSKGMWLLLAAMVVYTGFVVWSLEHRKIGTSLWFAFSTVVFAHRESIKSQWTRFVLAPWLFLILIITSTYTANLSSMLTNPQLESSETDIGSLKTTNAIVGYDGNSFTIWYLKEVLGFKEDNIKNITSTDDFANSLSNGHIRAAFMFSPHARVFLSEHCQRFTISGPTFKLTGFGYVFPKSSSLALDISEAIIHLIQSGELQQLEEQKIPNTKCSSSASNTENQSLGIGPFAGVFIISGSVSSVGLIVAAIRQVRTHWEEFTFFQTMRLCRGLWLWLASILTPKKAKHHEIELSIENCDPPTRTNNTC